MTRCISARPSINLASRTTPVVYSAAAVCAARRPPSACSTAYPTASRVVTTGSVATVDAAGPAMTTLSVKSYKNARALAFMDDSVT